MTEPTKSLGGRPAEAADARRERRQLRAEYGMGRLTFAELETALAELDSRNPDTGRPGREGGHPDDNADA